jgi:hypothetical protein
MSKARRKRPPRKGTRRREPHGAEPHDAEPRKLPEPVDVVDGIPDRAAHTPAWKLLLLAGIFLAWLAFLIYCAAAGNV